MHEIHVLDTTRLRGNIEIVIPVLIREVIELVMPELQGLLVVRAIVPFIICEKA